MSFESRPPLSCFHWGHFTGQGHGALAALSGGGGYSWYVDCTEVLFRCVHFFTYVDVHYCCHVCMFLYLCAFVWLCDDALCVGRLKALITSGALSTASIHLAVLDEADTLLDFASSDVLYVLCVCVCVCVCAVRDHN